MQTHASSKCYKPSALRTIQRSRSTGLAESLCAPPSPRISKLDCLFSNFSFFFKILVSSVQESGSRGFFPCQISRCGFLFLKFGFLRSGIWEFGATETLILNFFFDFIVRGRYRKDQPSLHPKAPEKRRRRSQPSWITVEYGMTGSHIQYKPLF